LSPYFNILCLSLKKPYYTENTNQFKHDIQLLYMIPSKLTIVADYEGQHVSRNSSCILCTLNSIVALLTVILAPVLLRFGLSDSAV